MIDYRLLEALAAVVSQQGFEKAARHLHLTQSAVSRRVQQLEHVLGQSVLVRCIPPQPTATGMRLLNHLQQVRQMEASLGLGDAEPELQVRLATNSDSLATWLPAALADAQTDSLHFDFIVEDQSVGLKRMKSGEVMVCICDSPNAVAGGTVDYLGALRYRAVASPAFVARYQLDKNDAQMLLQAPCLVFNHDDLIQHHYVKQQTGRTLEKIHLCPSSEGFMQGVLAGLGYGLLPELQMRGAIERGDLVDLSPDFTLDVPLYWHSWQTQSPALWKLRQHCLQYARRCLVQQR